jgi:glycosyltransferase involved in cell wall biosynthesis
VKTDLRKTENPMPSTVSIIIPCYNEQKTIQKLLAAIHAQTYPRADLEVIIADGMSTDQTRAEIAAFAGSHPDLHISVLDNPKRVIPAALNLALGEAKGEIIVRLDGHSIPYPDYVERCVSDLETGLGDNVGGIWEIHPGAGTWVAKSIAHAASHPLGVGDALYRLTEKPAYVDTVPFGAFKRELLALVGFFDETLLINEDYEFNARIRARGGKIWLDPAIRSVYYARNTFGSLAQQYWRYGFWKYRMLRRYPKTLRWRQGLPPLFVLSLVCLALLGLLWNGFHILLAAEGLLYASILIAAGIWSAWKDREGVLLFGLPASISVMHISWGSGFLWSIIKGMFTFKKTETA